MTGVRKSLTRTQFDAITEVVSAESFHIVLETNPPDYVEKISHSLESSVGQSGQEKVSNGPAEADSDSGDSLFITQKPVPEAERSGRRHTYSSRSKPASPRDLEESEEDTSSSTSHDEESKTDKKRRRIKKYKLPTYNFPFLAERKLKLRSSRLPDQNKNLLNYTMGGFFKCVRELRLEPKSSLPTVDTDGEDMSPLSEEDEDRSEVEDIKVVERKRLVEILSPSKAKRQQTWSTSLNQQRKRKASNAGQKTTRGRQTKMLHKDTVKASASKVVALSSVTESSDEGESFCRAPVQSERKDQHATRDGNFLAQTETPKRKECLVRGDTLSLRKASEEDSDATVCELPNWQSTQNGREASTPVTEPQTDAGNETEEKKKEDKEHHESVEEEVVEVSAVTESSDDGESSCRVLVQSERKDQHATRDGNFLAKTETPKRKGCLVRGDTLSLRKASEEDSDATVCELPNWQSTQNGREASTPVTEPQTDAGNETEEKKKEDKEHHESVEEEVVEVSAVTESSDDGESSCRVLVQSERKDQHATRDGNFLAKTETPKRKGCLVRGDTLSLRKASEEDSDATVCELPNWQSTQNGREASTPVTEPQTDAGNETEEKKKEDKEHHESVEEEVVEVSAVTESSDDGESSCRVLVQSERKDQHATRDGNFLAKTETPKRKGCLVRGDTLSLRKASEEDSDATVCELPNWQSTQNGREASTPVTEPQTDAGNETEEKKKEDKEHHESVEEEVVEVSAVTESSDDGESSCRVLAQSERKDQHATRDGNFLAKTETPKRKECLVRGDALSLRKASEEDSDATVCELPRRQSTQKGREASTPVTDPQTDAGNETEEKKKEDKEHHESVEEEVVAVSAVTESSDDRESSCRVLVQSERKDQHATSDRNFLAQTETPKRKGCLVQGGALSLRKASEEDSDATVCELPRRESTQNGREASIPVTDPQTDAGNETEEKKGKKKKKDKEHHESVEEGKGQSQEEPENVLRQEEGDIPDSKQKKKKKKKDKSAAENVGPEVDGSLESDVRVEDSNMEDGGKEKKKKKEKKRKRSGEDVEQLQSGAAVAEPPNDDAEIQKKKKKKRKKEEMIVITEEREEEEAANRTLGLPQMSTEQLEESGNCLEDAAASQETLDSGYVKRKKHKKKRQSFSNDATQDGEEGEDVSVCLDDSVTSAKGTSLKQKKKKTVFEWVNGSNTPDENEKVDNTQEGLEDQNAELVTKKKKKKKKSEIFSRDTSEDKVAQSDDSVSVREKKKERTSSFLVADAEENDAWAQGGADKPGVSAGDLEELNDGVMKKKKKRKMSVAQDNVEKDHKQDFEEPKKSALPETTDARVKKKKKRTGSGSEEERLEADAGLSPTEEAVVLKKKKKKKKKCEDEQEGPPTASEDIESVALNSCSSVSHKKKGEHGHRAEISHDSSTTSDRASKETLNAVELGHQALNGSRDKKKKKKIKSTDNVMLDGNSLTESAELEHREIKKKQRNKQSAVPSIISETSLSKFEMSSSDNIMKNKHKKVKRLYNPSEDFLSDC